jgi:hypothetical protein
MTQRTKKYTVRFYKARYGADGKSGCLWNVLSELESQDDVAMVMPAGDTAYQLRGITLSLDRKSLSGYLVRFRLDKPAVGSKTTLEEEYLELDDGKEFIEKNHFVLFKETPSTEILGYQCCREGGVISVLARYLTFITGEKETISFDDILTKESLDVIFKKGLIKSVEFTVAKPILKNGYVDPEDGWTQDSFDILKESGGTKFTGKIAVQSRSLGLLQRAKDNIRKLLSSEHTKRLKVKVSGVEEPIDLFAERIYDRIEVGVESGGVINSISIYDGIRNVKDQKQHHFDANFKDE